LPPADGRSRSTIGTERDSPASLPLPVGLALAVARGALAAGGQRRVALFAERRARLALGVGGLAGGRGRHVLQQRLEAALPVAPEDRVDELVDDLAGALVGRRLDAQLAGQRAGAEEANRVEVERAVPGGHQAGEVDRAAHARAVAQVRPAARLARDVGGEGDQRVRGRPGAPPDDLDLLPARLVVELQDQEAVGQPARQARRADVVERVGRADDREAFARLDAPQPRDLDVALRQRGEQRVEGARGRPVELLDVEDPAGGHRPRERAGEEVLGPVAVGDDARGVEPADERVGRELLVAGHVDEAVGAVAELGREGADHRRLGDAGQPQQQDGPATADRVQEQRELPAATDHGPHDVVR
jgi:hypothetical protein